MTDSEELAHYRAIAQKYNADPKLKAKYLRLYKEAFPDANVPEVDLADNLENKFQEELKKRDEEIKELKEGQFKKRFEDDYERKRQRLAGAPWYFDDEQVKAAEELVEKKGFPEVELAADYIRATTQPLKPSGLGILGFNPAKNSKQERADFNKRFAPIFKNNRGNDEILRDAINKASTGEYLNEMQK